MKKSQRLIEIQRYITRKKEFTAKEIADEFNISIRTVYRDMLELAELGVYYYTEQGSKGGYRLLSAKLLPPVSFTEDEAMAIFFASHSLTFYNSLPFEVDIKTVLRKLYNNLSLENQRNVDNMKSKLIFRNKKRNLVNTYLKDILQYCDTNKIMNLEYNSVKGIKKYKVVFICLYSENGFWYFPSLDLSDNMIKHYRVDRVVKITDTNQIYKYNDNLLYESFNFSNYENPIRLYVKLNEKGIRECLDNPYIGNDIQVNSTGDEGFIDELIDEKDIKFLGNFFINLAENAIVIEPLKMREYIYNKSLKINKIYSE